MRCPKGMKKKYPVGHKQSKEWLTKEEYNRIINYPHISRKNEIIISLLYSCALRVSELLNIRIEDIDINNATIIIWESKNTKDPALVPVPITLLKMLNQWISENSLSQKKYLFSSNRSKTISRSQLSRIIISNGNQAGIEKTISTHTFRRTRATHLLDAGLPLEQVSRLLRHLVPCLCPPRVLVPHGYGVIFIQHYDLLANFNQRITKGN